MIKITIKTLTFKIANLVCVFGIFACVFTQDQSWGMERATSECSYPGVRKINENFYAGKFVKDSLPLLLIMERVDERNHGLWQGYMNVQANPRLSCLVQATFPNMKGNPLDGSSAANAVLLGNAYYKKYEIWMAYITKASEACPIPDTMKNYNCASVSGCMVGENEGADFARDILMSVTVTSTPNALLTTHLGISGSLETMGKRPGGLSMYLHAFAAQVMLMRNAERKYMINAPVPAMLQIMLKEKSLQGSVFVGTREMQQTLKELSQKTDEELEESLDIGDMFNSSFMDKDDWREHVQRMAVDELNRCSDLSSSKFLDTEGYEVRISPQKVRNEAKRKFMLRLRCPYGSCNGFESLLTLIAQNPPIFSATCEKKVLKSFAVGDGEKIAWQNPVYGWMFESVYGPLGDDTHYVLTDLRALANCRTFVPYI